MNTTESTGQYLRFKNKGEVPVNAFKLLGASTKRNDNSKIGFFGTGLKYAFAVLLRENIDFRVFVGDKEVKIGTVKTDFGGNKVSVMTVNKEKTSITIDAGIDWLPWFAIREIYSNTIDENGTMDLDDTLEGEAGYTTIYIEMSDKLGDVSTNWQQYFSFKRPYLWSDGSGNKIYSKKNDERYTVFRKGIRVFYSSIISSIYDYDLNDVSINESRVAKHDFQVRQSCAESLAICNDVSVVEGFISQWETQLSTTGKKYIEFDTNFWHWLFDSHQGKFSEAWYEVLKDCRIVPTEQSGFYGLTQRSIALPNTLVKHLNKTFGNRLDFAGLTKEKYKIVGEYNPVMDEPLRILGSFGMVFDKENIKIAQFKDPDIHGMYDDINKLIVISEKSISPVARTSLLPLLFEEIAHAESGYSDCTRSFQDYIIKIATNLMLDKKIS